MIRSRHIAIMGALGTLLLVAVFIAMFGSAMLVARLAAIDAEQLARNLIASLEAEFDLPGEPVAEQRTLLDQAVAFLLEGGRTRNGEFDLFDTSAFEAREHFGTVRGYAIFTRFGQLTIAGGTPLVRKLEPGPMQTAVHEAINRSESRVLPLTEADGGNKAIVSAIIPLVRNGNVRGAISVEIERHRFEIVMQKGVQFAAMITAGSTGAMGLAGIIMLYVWGRTAQHAQRQATFLAHTDPVTLLPNRRKFEEDLAAALAARSQGAEQIAIAFSDVDNFKIVNDAYGHASGDTLLVEIGRRLGKVLRNSDQIYRISGDNFAMILRVAEGDEELKTIGANLQLALNQPLLPDDYGVMLSVSSGFALAPRDGDTADQLMKAADMGLYRAKTDGRRTFRIFTAEMGAEIKGSMRLQLDLEQALARDELHLEYQPQIDSSSGRLIGFEALARWTHPEEGPIPPTRFIPVAEQCGLITKLGEWALRRAAAEAMDWPGDIAVAVNLSPAQLRDPRFIGLVKAVLHKTGLQPSRLELEVTESVMMQDTDLTQHALKSIRNLGVGLAMDDFGTGYSSLSYLTRIPLTKLKIDKSFVDQYGVDEKGGAVVDVLIQLANRLGLTITAEGVETVEQAKKLTRAGCTSLQGYLFGRPVRDPQNFIEAMVASGGNTARKEQPAKKYA